MNTALQIGGFATHQERLWLSALVLHGAVSAGDRLQAVGLASAPCLIDEVRVAGLSRRALAGDDCQLFLRDPDAAFRRDAARLYFALVEPGAAAPATRLRAALTWATLHEGPGPASSFAPAVQALSADTRVELRFGDIRVPATLLKPDAVLPPSGTQTCNLTLDRPLPLIPGLRFSMTLNGRPAAMGKVLPPAPASSPSPSR